MTQSTVEGRSPVIFCDFDGTITQRDVIIMIMEAFAPPEWRDIVDRILNQRTLSIRDGVQQLFELIPGSKRAEIEEFVAQNVKLRDGFPEILDFCQARNIPFLVLSGGVDFFLNPVLASYREKLSIYCNSATFTPSAIQINMPYYNENCEPCGQCGCCKISLMEPYDPATHFRIAIGDSLTDLPMAKTADWTFARGQLVSYCQEENIPTTPFENFHDVLNTLKERLVMSSVS